MTKENALCLRDEKDLKKKNIKNKMKKKNRFLCLNFNEFFYKQIMFT